MVRSLVIALVICLAGFHPARGDDFADARAEMTAALVVQVELHPSPALLPTRAAAPQHAAAPSAVQQGTNQRAAAAAGARTAEAWHSLGASQSLVRQVQAAAAAAAGQAQGQAGKQRASHPRPTPPR